MKLCDTLLIFINLLNNETPHSAEWFQSTIHRNKYQRPRLLETDLDDLRSEKRDTSWVHLPISETILSQPVHSQNHQNVR